ncbi:MAG: signal peptidase I [Candidatus Lokiarchaeota archaeon]|nr:signal peptidase I [Candidatus Lokiarchaeota archaeon]MBD3201406.1 signal peptidase I [Candidatus Lokiarchaeota archaeon]
MEIGEEKKKSPKKDEPRSKKKIIIAIVLISSAILTPFLVYWLLQVTLNTSTPMVVVVSESMEPNLLVGDLLFLNGKNPTDIQNGTVENQQGDIIVFDSNGVWPVPQNEPIVHRVVNKTNIDGVWYFKTKGDNNAVVDPGWVPESNIIGVVCGRIPFIGWLKIVLTESNLLIPLIVLIIGLLIISLIWDAYKEDIQKDDNSKRIYDEKNEGK